jgi:hypothetical protein
MKRLTALLFCSLLSFAAPATAQSGAPLANAKPQPSPAVPFRLEPVKQARKGVDLWPLIANPATPAQLRVNTILGRLNRRLLKALPECDAGALENMKRTSKIPKGYNPASEDWSRKVQVTMLDPRYLSLVEREDTYCGGAHPDSGQMALVFDMTTGSPVNWVAQLPASAKAASASDYSSDGSTVGALVLPALLPMTIAAADADCKEVFSDGQSFQIWLDAKRGTLVAQPFGMVHAVSACAQEINLTIEQARKMGFSEKILEALEQAHLQIAATPKR